MADVSSGNDRTGKPGGDQLCRQNDITIQSAIIGSRFSPLSSLCPKLSGNSHGLRCDWKILDLLCQEIESGQSGNLVSA